MRFDCAVFDMDGTLVDSAAIWIEAKLNILSSRGIPYTAEDSANLSNRELEASSEYLCANFPLDITPEQAAQEILAYADHCYAHTVAPIPGAVELLERVHAMGIPCCLATGTPRERYEPLLRRLGMLHLLDHFVTVYDVPRGKHFPDIYLEAIRRAGADPARTVVFEDTGYSIKAAKQAGLYVVTVRQPSTNGGPECLALCDLLVDDLTQLPADFWEEQQ